MMMNSRTARHGARTLRSAARGQQQATARRNYGSRQHGGKQQRGKTGGQQQQQQQQRAFYGAATLDRATMYGGGAVSALLLGGGVYAYMAAFDDGNRVAMAAPAVDYDKVRADVEAILDADGYDDGSTGPVLVRLAWHTAGTYSKHDNTGGSEGASIRFKPESAHDANAGLEVARALLEPIKAAHPGISYADLYTLAGGVAIEAMGGPKIKWHSGRSDARDASACTPDGRLPDAAQGQDHIRDIFYRMGFNDREIVALAGAHALGRCHADRSGFDGPWTHSPTMFSNDFFVLLLNETWTVRKWKGPLQYENAAGDLMMLPSDVALLKDDAFKALVEEYAGDEKKFFSDFAAAFTKLMELGVPTLNKSLWEKIFG